MISRRDNLYVRPWQMKQYENHRKKVISALPVIDNKPPPSRMHIDHKGKKQQKEKERCVKIERENHILLQKLNHIMRTNRVDNKWKTPQPKIGIYKSQTLNLDEIDFDSFMEVIGEKEEEDKTEKRIRKQNCYACTPQIDNFEIVEERVPWEPPKPSVSRFRSKSVPVRKVAKLPIIKESVSLNSSAKLRKSRPKEKIVNKDGEENDAKQPTIILTRGCLHLSVNFPSDTTVRFIEGKSEKYLMKNVCYCKTASFPKVY